MIVSELIEELKKVDQNLLVVLSSDEEGNSFNNLNVCQVDRVYDEDDETWQTAMVLWP